MLYRKLLPVPLTALAAAQSGVLSRGQLLGAGLSSGVVERLIGQGYFNVISPGIYARVSDIGFMGWAWAGVLIGGPHSVIGGQAAAFLHDLVREEPRVITIHSPRRLTDRDRWQFTRSPRTGSGEPPRTGIDATTIDLCAQLDEDAIAAVLANAVSSRKTTAKRLRTELERRARLRNGAVLRQVLGDVAVGAHSALERRYLIAVERPHGLPTATRQAHAHRLHRSDVWYEQQGVLVELDSRLHHTGGAAFRDMRRDNDHAAAGIITLRFGWGHVTGVAACQTAHDVSNVLASRGWEGLVTTCSRCRLVPGWR